MAVTKIEWAKFTFNPWRGCEHATLPDGSAHPGCLNCYAEAMSKRNPATLGTWGNAQVGRRIVAAESYWRLPLKWNRDAAADGHRPRVFCASLADVFDDWYPPILRHDGCSMWCCVHCGKFVDGALPSVQGNVGPTCCGQVTMSLRMSDLRRRLFALIDATPHLDWLLLTKRPENIRRMWPARILDSGPPTYPEEIRPIDGTDGYHVSNHGRVLSSKGSENCVHCGKPIVGAPHKMYCSGACKQAAFKLRRSGGAASDRTGMRELSLNISDDGYTTVAIYRNGVPSRELVHRLVLTAFDRSPVADEQGCHKDRNPRNNAIHNIRWGSQSSNWDDSKTHGTHRRYSKLTEDDVAIIRHRAECGESFSQISESFPVSATQISNVVNERQWSAPNHFRPNCWLLTSVSDQATADAMIPPLMRCHDLVPVLGVSAEPLVGPIDLTELTSGPDGGSGWTYRHVDSLTNDTWCDCRDHIDSKSTGALKWVIVGGESGPGARPCNVEWIRSIVAQCKAAGLPCFVKQLGSFPVDSGSDGDRADWLKDDPDYYRVRGIKDKKGGTPVEWPGDLRVRELPEQAHA